MATSTDARAAKERKQKIFVAVGGLLLVGLLALQLPKLLGGSDSAAAPPAETTTVGEAPAPGTPAPTTVSVALVDTDRPLAPGPGQLGSFGAFASKDPFVQQVRQRAPAPVTPAPAPATPKKPKAVAPTKDFSAEKKASAAGTTVVSVNGVRYGLEPGAKFPTADPVFVLVSVQPDAKTAVVGVPGGKLQNGSRTTKLEAGKPIVLVNTTTKTRYRLVLVTVGAATAAAPAGRTR